MKPDLVRRWGVILSRTVSLQGSRIDTRGFTTRKVDWIKENTHSCALELNKGRGKRIIKSNWGVFCGSKSHGNEMERLGLWRTEASRSSDSYICRSSFLHSLLVFSLSLLSAPPPCTHGWTKLDCGKASGCQLGHTQQSSGKHSTQVIFGPNFFLHPPPFFA